MEELAQTMLTPTLAPVGLASLASTAKPTSMTALKALALTEGPAQIKSMGTPALVVQASQAPTVSTRSMSVTPSPALTVAYVKTLWSLSVAHVQRASLATAVRPLWTGADVHLLAKTVDAVAKRILLSHVTVLMAGLDVIVTFPGCLVKQLPAKEGSRQMSFATVEVTVSTQGMHTTVNVLTTTLGAIVKAKWTIVKTNPAAMAPPAGVMLEVTSVIVCQASLGRAVR